MTDPKKTAWRFFRFDGLPSDEHGPVELTRWSVLKRQRYSGVPVRIHVLEGTTREETVEVLLDLADWIERDTSSLQREDPSEIPF